MYCSHSIQLANQQYVQSRGTGAAVSEREKVWRDVPNAV
jgi:hypothetical protein